jgi:hypothetical protein
MDDYKNNSTSELIFLYQLASMFQVRKTSLQVQLPHSFSFLLPITPLYWVHMHCKYQ